MKQIAHEMLTESDIRMLDLLSRQNDLASPATLGSTLWSKRSTSRKPQSYARPAVRVLNRLHDYQCAQHVVRFGIAHNIVRTGWEITTLGKTILKERATAKAKKAS